MNNIPKSFIEFITEYDFTTFYIKLVNEIEKENRNFFPMRKEKEDIRLHNHFEAYIKPIETRRCVI